MVKALNLAIGVALMSGALLEPTPIGEVVAGAIIADAVGVKIPLLSSTMRGVGL